MLEMISGRRLTRQEYYVCVPFVFGSRFSFLILRNHFDCSLIMLNIIIINEGPPPPHFIVEPTTNSITFVIHWNV